MKKSLENVNVNFSTVKGKIKPMHAVNNAPMFFGFSAAVGQKKSITNANLFEEAEIPFVRTHDAACSRLYGGDHVVDIPNIFKNFDADPTDPSSYDFGYTDIYLQSIQKVGAEIFYRLGVSAKPSLRPDNHNIYPPKDFHKWAVICEHVIRHYNEGWANGFNMNIKYWEIWNEPDLKGFWQGGTNEQFFEFYEIVAKHLKSKFPNIKIGGPALAGSSQVNSNGFGERFIKYVVSNKAPLDFYSWHRYSVNPQDFLRESKEVDEMLKIYCDDKVESIFNEWNYVIGWEPNEIIDSYKTIKSLKGAAFISGTMCILQGSPTDILMYYDARPSSFCGMFNSDTWEPLKGYYPFYMFNSLYKLGTEVTSETSCDNLYVCAAKNENENESAVMLSYYDYNEDAEAVKVKLNMKGFASGSNVKVEYYALDNEHDAELVSEEIFTGAECSLVIKMELYTTLLIKLTKL